MTLIYRSLLLFVFFIPFLSYCQQNNEQPLVVRLGTDQKLMPLYLAPFDANSSGYESLYVKSLEGVLRFDLSHNARTQVLANSPQKNQLANSKNFEEFGKISEWNKSGIAFVVKVQIKDKKITARILQVGTNNIKTTDALSLSGNLSQDRRQIHLLADTIHKALFGMDGIASTRVLYTFKYPIQKQSQLDWISEIWEMDYDGANLRKVTDDVSGYCIAPCYVPPKAGNRSAAFFYVSYKNGQPKIYVSTLKEGSPLRLNYLRGNQLMPAVSRQRDKIAFISDIAGNPDLFIQEFSPEAGPLGKPKQIFTARQATQGTPSFSPDGKQIAFVSNKDGSARVYILAIPLRDSDIKNNKPTLISRACRESTAPCWSPDGSKIAFCARSNKDRQIWIYDFETDEEWQLTDGPSDKENPSWAPDSLHLMYNTTGKNTADLYMIDLNQRYAEKVTNGNGEMRFASWEPR